MQRMSGDWLVYRSPLIFSTIAAQTLRDPAGKGPNVSISKPDIPAAAARQIDRARRVR
tara:strand:- start:4929 stop:5102 length:174 start_codon:yes stop_codon:yes gene_type:complete